MQANIKSIKLAVTSKGELSGEWQKRIEEVLAKTDNLSSSPLRADALIVVIDDGFLRAMQQLDDRQDNCFHSIRAVLAAGKLLLPVIVGKVCMPDPESLPEEIRDLYKFQALSLETKSKLPGIVARLVYAARTINRSYVPSKIDDRRVFISYRREDSWYWASLLARALAQRIASRNVFFDLSSIAPGRLFDSEIQTRIRDCTDFVILIGTQYLATDSKGRRRIDDPKDFVHREIAAAITHRKHIHIILASNATLQDEKLLPAGIAQAFINTPPKKLIDFRDADTAAELIIADMSQIDVTQSSKQAKPASKLLFKGILSIQGATKRHVQTPEQKAINFINAALPPLIDHGWQPVDLSKSRGPLIVIRSEDPKYRFVFDFENTNLILEEYASRLKRLRTKGWVKRSFFPVSPDEPDIDVLRPPDRQVEAMENPKAYLDRTGRVDLDMAPPPPKSSAELSKLMRRRNQPSRRALDQHARDQAIIRKRGGFRVLSLRKTLSLNEYAIAQKIDVDRTTGRFGIASDSGAFFLDNHLGPAQLVGKRDNLVTLSFSKSGLIATADNRPRLSVTDQEGNWIVRNRTPYSTLKKIIGDCEKFRNMSWSADDQRIAIGTSYRTWIFNIESETFEHIAIKQDREETSSTVQVHYIPGSDDLLILQLWMLWRVDSRTGRIRCKLDFKAGSDYYDAFDFLNTNNIIPNCMVLSPDGKTVAMGCNHAHLVFINADTLKPTAMRVFHAPLVDERWNGQIEAVAFSPNGSRLASVANDSRLILMDAKIGDPIADGIINLEPSLRGSKIKRDLCWSSNGEQIAVVNSAGKIEVWDTAGI